jgi:hypothetical protein
LYRKKAGNAYDKKTYRKLIEDMLAEPLLATNDEYGIAASTRARS